MAADRMAAVLEFSPMFTATLHRTAIALTVPFLLCTVASAQCTNYIIFMEDDPNAADVSWSFVDQFGVTVLSGGAPFSTTICLPDGCYTLLMFDSGGDDWDGLDWEIEEVDGPWGDHTTLNNSSQDFEQFELGNGDCNAGGGANCSGGQNPFYIDSNPGGSPGQMSWSLALNGVVISSGGSNTNDTLCLDPGCLVLVMNDSGNNGWQGGSIVIKDENATVVYSGTLASGATQTVSISIDGGSCADPGGGPGGGGPGGGGIPGTGPGGGCSLLPPGGDCATAGCACDPFVFQITPSGFGNVNEVPPAGSLSNPSFTSGPPWGGSASFGCLLAGELNSRWITITIGTSGSLQFAFGAGGEQAGFYDWAMWPLAGASTCDGIKNNTLAPVRCVWNATTVGGTGLASPLPLGGDPGNYGPPLNVTAGEQYLICLSNWSFVNASVTLDFFGSAVIQCGAGPLPIELIRLQATPVESSVLVDWMTASERNSDHFEVQRSPDADAWTTIGNVPASGNTSVLTAYELLDEQPYSGINYYRLQEVDVDGSVTLSHLVSAYLPMRPGVNVFPQPSCGVFTVSGSQGEVPIVLDRIGRAIPIADTRVEDGDRIRIDLGNAAPGIYVLQFLRSGTTNRLIVQ